MITKCFIDTNIWLHGIICGDDYKKHMKASDLILNADNIIISTQVIREVTANLLRKADVEDNFVQEFVVDAYLNYKIACLNEQIYSKAYSLRYDFHFSYWDSVIIATALLSDCEILYSDVLSDKKVIEGRMEIVNPIK